MQKHMRFLTSKLAEPPRAIYPKIRLGGSASVRVGGTPEGNIRVAGFAPLGTPEGNIRAAGLPAGTPEGNIRVGRTAPLGTPEGNIRVQGFAPLTYLKANIRFHVTGQP